MCCCFSLQLTYTALYLAAFYDRRLKPGLESIGKNLSIDTHVLDALDGKYTLSDHLGIIGVSVSKPIYLCEANGSIHACIHTPVLVYVSTTAHVCKSHISGHKLARQPGS